MTGHFSELQLKHFVDDFEKEFGHSHFPVTVVCAPARVNLIGDHIDYNGGVVFPCAVNLYLKVAVRKNTTQTFVYKSSNQDRFYTFDISEMLKCDETKGFANYINAAIVFLRQRGLVLDSGFELYIESEIPMGSGLSSSAALEVATILALCHLFSFELSRKEVACLGQECENKFLGLQSGIMDQFIIAHAQADTAMLLNTRTLTFELKPFLLKEHRLVVINSCKPRSLVESKYNERKAECETALSILKPLFKIDNLCELTEKDIGRVEQIFLDRIESKDFEVDSRQALTAITGEVLFKRTRHCIYENSYVLHSCRALEAHNIKEFGNLMYASHRSLSNDYEVSGKELNSLVTRAMESSYCLGSRMTGAGFSGCAIALVHVDGLDSFFNTVRTGYKKDCNLDCEFYICNAVDGAQVL